MDDWKDLPAVENEPSRAHPHEKVLHPKFIRDIVFKTKKNRSTSRGRKPSKMEELLSLDNFRFTQKFLPASSINTAQKKERALISGCNILGQWKNDKLHGSCQIWYPEGEVFQGRYDFGVRVEGRIIFRDGSEYWGKFCDNLFHGPGIITDPRSRKISCYWNKGVAGRRGRIVYPGGQIYIGQIENLRKNGHGCIYMKEGERFVGNFVDGKAKGYGEYFKGNECICKGHWQNGVLINSCDSQKYNSSVVLPSQQVLSFHD